jgi:hypothetical protein
MSTGRPRARLPPDRVLQLAILVAGAAALLWATRGLTYLMDEWDMIQYRWPGNLDAYFLPHNQHLIVVEVLVFKTFSSVFGVEHYAPYRVLLVVVHVVCVFLLVEIARHRVGFGLALLVTLPVVFLGSAWFTVLNPFNVLWMISVASLLGIILLLDRPGRADRGRDAGVAALLLVCLASSSFGPAVAAGVLVHVLRREDRWRRLWIALVPAGLYGLWYASYGADAGRAPGWEASLAPDYFLSLAAGSLGALLGAPLGVSGIPGRSLLAVALHLLAVALIARLAYDTVGRRRMTPELAMALTILAGWWLTLTLGRGYLRTPYSTHYLYVSVVMILVVGLEVFRGRTVSPLARRLVAAAALVSTASNIVLLVHYSGERRHDAAVVAAQVGALELARGAVPAGFRVNADPEQAHTIRAGAYFRGTGELGGTPAPSPSAIARAPGFARRAADQVLIRALGLVPRPATEAIDGLVAPSLRRRPAASVERTTNANAWRRGRCTLVQPTGGGTGVAQLLLPSVGVSVTSEGGGTAELRVRRFADDFTGAPSGRVAGRAYVLTPSAPATGPWYLRVSSNKRFALC